MTSLGDLGESSTAVRSSATGPAALKWCDPYIRTKAVRVSGTSAPRCSQNERTRALYRNVASFATSEYRQQPRSFRVCIGRSGGGNMEELRTLLADHPTALPVLGGVVVATAGLAVLRWLRMPSSSKESE